MFCLTKCTYFFLENYIFFIIFTEIECNETCKDFQVAAWRMSPTSKLKIKRHLVMNTTNNILQRAARICRSSETCWEQLTAAGWCGNSTFWCWRRFAYHTNNKRGSSNTRVHIVQICLHSCDFMPRTGRPRFIWDLNQKCRPDYQRPGTLKRQERILGMN